MARKSTNLAVAVDVPTAAEMLRIADQARLPRLCAATPGCICHGYAAVSCLACEAFMACTGTGTTHAIAYALMLSSP
jgi:hypothetical protein